MHETVKSMLSCENLLVDGKYDESRRDRLNDGCRGLRGDSREYCTKVAIFEETRSAVMLNAPLEHRVILRIRYIGYRRGCYLLVLPLHF